MTLRNGHGSGAGVPRVEVLPADELPAGVPAVGGAEASLEGRDRTGRFAQGNQLSTREARARWGTSRLADALGPRGALARGPLRRYRNAAEAFRRAQVRALARDVGGGICGAAPSSLVASAATQLAWSRYLSDRAAETGDADLATKASRFANDSRQNLLAAHELCAKEAAARVAQAKPAAPWQLGEGEEKETTE